MADPGSTSQHEQDRRRARPSHPGPTSAGDGVPELVQFMRVFPETAALIRMRHTRDAQDTCVECSGQLRSTPWPCVLLLSALEAATRNERDHRLIVAELPTSGFL